MFKKTILLSMCLVVTKLSVFSQTQTITPGKNGGTGIANTGKTITIGGSIVTTGTATPTLAFPSTNRTYRYRDSSGTLALTSDLNGLLFIPLGGTTNASPVTNTIEYRGSSGTTVLVDTIVGNTMFVGMGNRKDLGTNATKYARIKFDNNATKPIIDMIAKYDVTGAFGEVKLAKNNVILYADDGTSTVSQISMNGTSISTTSTYTNFPGEQYEYITCNYINANADSTTKPHLGYIQRLIAAAGLSFVPTSRTLTINGTTFDLSANRTWTIPSATLSSTQVGVGNGSNLLGGSADLTDSNNVLRLTDGSSLTNFYNNWGYDFAIKKTKANDNVNIALMNDGGGNSTSGIYFVEPSSPLDSYCGFVRWNNSASLNYDFSSIARSGTVNLNAHTMGVSGNDPVVFLFDRLYQSRGHAGTDLASVFDNDGFRMDTYANIHTANTNFFRLNAPTGLSNNIIHLDCGTPQQGKQALYVTGTFQTGATGPTAYDMINFSVNSTNGGSGINTQYALGVDLNAGGTDAAGSVVGRFNNSRAGTGTNILGGAGNVGIYAYTNVTTTGHSAGVFGYGYGGNLSIGTIGYSPDAKNSATNVGVVGLGLNTGTSPVQVGGYFGLRSTFPTFVSAALIADNGATSSPIFLAQKAGTTILSVNNDNSTTIGTSAVGGLFVNPATTLRDASWNQGIELQANSTNAYPSFIFSNQTTNARYGSVMFTRSSNGNDQTKEQGEISVLETGNIGLFQVALNANIGTTGVTAVLTAKGGVGVGLGGISAASVTAKAHIAAGTTAANTGPLKLTVATASLVTTPEVGLIETDASGNLYYTPSSSNRYKVGTVLTATATLDFPSTNASSVSTLTMTVTGAEDGDAISIGVPNGSITTTDVTNYYAWVSASGVVTIKFINGNLITAVDPASGTFKATVIKN